MAVVRYGKKNMNNRSRYVASHKLQFVKLWDCYRDFEKEQDEKSPVAKNQPVGANWWEDISTFMFWRLYTNRSIIGLDRNVYHVGLLILEGFICMESSEHIGVYIFPPICTNRLISRKWSFFIFSNLCHNFKNLVFVTSLLLFSYRALSLTGIQNKRALL